MSASAPRPTEIPERRRLHADIDRALADLDLDGMRFVLVVALVRGMKVAELDRLVMKIGKDKLHE